MTTDEEVIIGCLDNAREQSSARNAYAEGYWMGRAISHAEQNAIDLSWLMQQVEERGLETLAVPIPDYG